MKKERTDLEILTIAIVAAQDYLFWQDEKSRKKLTFDKLVNQYGKLVGVKASMAREVMKKYLPLILDDPICDQIELVEAAKFALEVMKLPRNQTYFSDRKAIEKLETALQKSTK